MEKIGIIIQARTGSERLPKKVIKKIAGKTVLELIIERIKNVKKIQRIILATTSKKEDDILEEIAKDCGIDVFRGSEEDVLDRFYQAAKLYGLDHIVRITGDCPLIDFNIVGDTVEFYLKGNFDYVGNSHPPTFPDGMDVEVIGFKSLEKIWKNAADPSDREHVTSYVFRDKNNFNSGNLESEEDFYDLRLTLDEEKDLTLIKEIYKKLYKKNPKFGLKDITELLVENPELIKINQEINSKPISRWQKDQKSL